MALKLPRKPFTTESGPKLWKTRLSRTALKQAPQFARYLSVPLAFFCEV